MLTHGKSEDTFRYILFEWFAVWYDKSLLSINDVRSGALASSDNGSE